ncbi:uncharacterized protein LOC134656594 [Cydia amplana]|uniref:uncharacterized protein LOC134656594 n=1 Tax=Cydia amplana TaxID=1869771 RepID=UPI002FE5AF5F
MSANVDDADDADDEYLDDPISLLNIEDIKTEISDEDQIIDVSSDSDEEETSAYGKTKSFVLPVRFFDISRNVKLLNKCKPLSVRIVDCKQHPTYYTKDQEKSKDKSDENCVEVQNTCDSNIETNLNYANAEGIVNISHTRENAGEMSMNLKEGEKKRQSDSFYEKLKKRKEERKRVALNCKDLGQVDFKRNTGLVGLKITDTIFKQIVDTEKALINAKCSSVESKPQDKNQNDAEKPSITSKTITSDDKCNEPQNSVVEKALAKCMSIEKKCAENNEKYHSNSRKSSLYTKQTISSDENSRGNIASTMENWPIKKSTHVENKSNDKNESDKNKTKKKSDITGHKEIKTNTKSVIKCKEKMSENSSKALIRNQCNPKEKFKEEVLECSKYMKKVGATLDNLGTSIIPLINNYTPKSSHNNSEIKNIKAGASQNTYKDVKDSSQNKISLKTLSDNVIENALKLKKSKPKNKNAANIVLQKKKPHAKVIAMDTKVLLKHSNIEGSVISDKGKEPSKSTISKQQDSNPTKQIDKVVVKDASRDQAGPNSPVIPCTTITIRAATPKLTPKETSAEDTIGKQDSATFSITPYTDTETPSLRNMAELRIPRPPSAQLNKESFIGNTADGDPIKKINIPVVTPIVDDKQKMLAELNNAMMSPEVKKNQNDDPPKDLKRKADVPIDPVKPKHSKPGPLSKKTNITTDSSNVKITDKLSSSTGYSPPILPIFSYQESFKIFPPNDDKNSGMSVPTDTQNRTPLKRTTSTASIRKYDKNHKRILHHENGNQDKAKKISYEDYRKRVIKDNVDKMDVNKVRKYNESKNAADDYNLDQGYDSDSTVKL